MLWAERRQKTVPPASSKTDWNRIRNMTEQEIQRGIDSDPDSAPDASYEETKAQYKPHPPRMRQ